MKFVNFMDKIRTLIRVAKDTKTENSFAFCMYTGYTFCLTYLVIFIKIIKQIFTEMVKFSRKCIYTVSDHVKNIHY